MNDFHRDFTQPSGSIANSAPFHPDSGAPHTTIQSYLVFPAEGHIAGVAAALSALPGCEVLPAENRPVLILVTETSGRDAQRDLERRLEDVENAASISLVSGWTE